MSPLSPAAVARLIDHTLLKPEAGRADVARLCEEARRHRFHSVCVNPVHVAAARTALEGSGVAVCSVVGFPLGAARPDVKAVEASAAIDDGAGEIDMVLQVGALREGDDEAVRSDIAGVAAACAAAGALCKVILETALLDDQAKARACRLAAAAGAHFVKTSTGFGPGGATVADVALLARTAGPLGLLVKASGGIRTLADLEAMVAAGAARVGCSASVAILGEAEARARR